MQDTGKTRIAASIQESICPGCGLSMPVSSSASYDGYFHTSPECWSVFTEVIGLEFSNAFLFGRVHQLTVDSYAVQHAGGNHPDKSVVIHLAGLYLSLVVGVAPVKVPGFLQRLAGSVSSWPHLLPPAEAASITVFDVAMSDSILDHIDRVREWAAQVWESWSLHHRETRDLVAQHVPLSRPEDKVLHTESPYTDQTGVQ